MNHVPARLAITKPWQHITTRRTWDRGLNRALSTGRKSGVPQKPAGEWLALGEGQDKQTRETATDEIWTTRRQDCSTALLSSDETSIVELMQANTLPN